MKNKHKTMSIAIIGTLYSGIIALVTYINSEYLTTIHHIEVSKVGLLYSLGSLLGILLIPFLYKITNKLGNKNSLLAFVSLFALSVVSLSFLKTSQFVFVIFPILLCSVSIIYYILDYNLEHFTKSDSAGSTRGLYLSLSNIGWLFFPLIAALLVHSAFGFQGIYLIAFVLSLVVLGFISKKISHYKEHVIKETGFIHTFNLFWGNEKYRFAFLCEFLLNFFFTTMAIYLPIYLIEVQGLTYTQLGLTLTIMLLPFVLFSHFYGKLADRTQAEKGILLLAFILLAITTSLLGILQPHDWWIWGILLFCTRVFASLVETTTESYYFRNTDDKQKLSLSIFRGSAPLAIIVAPICMSFLLSVFGLSLQYVWLVLAFIILLFVLILDNLPKGSLHKK